MRDDMTSGRAVDGAESPGRGWERAGHAADRRRTRGPRPVRPAAARIAVRPGRPARPVCRSVPGRPGSRLLVRRSAPHGSLCRPAPVRRRVPIPLGERVRRVLAGVAVVVATAAVVVGLGLLAAVAGGSRLADGAPSQDPGASTVLAPAALPPLDVLPGQVWEAPLR